MAKKLWKIAEHDDDAAVELSCALGISPLLAKLLVNRGIIEPTQAKTFLSPEMSQLHDPFLFNDMRRAAERIVAASRNQEPVLIYGDYDVDGITATTLLVRIMARLFPGRLLYHLPKRLEEGYGLHLASLEKALARGISLVITVDCGISAVAEALYLKSRGIDLIITDHHEPPPEIPDAYAIIDPKIPGSGYPFSQLAGVGVAFKLLQALAALLPEITERLYRNMDLVALGTVADIVPLLDENRVLVTYGLKQIQNTENIGLQSLIQVAGLKDKEITCGHIGFVLAPRINAVGRISNPSTGVKLFLTHDPIQAMDLANVLENENQNRQEIETRVLQEAQAIIAATPSLADEHGLVLAGEGWHPGVIGIVASRLVEMYNKPTILIGLEGDEGRGSGRSIAGFNLFEAIGECGQYLARFGGHEFAAGLTIRRAEIPAFREAFLRIANRMLTKDELIPTLRVEGLIELKHATLDLARELSRLAPCGPANPTPVLGCESVYLVDYKMVGENGKHLKIRVKDERVTREGIGFNLGHVNQELAATKEVDLAFVVEENTWNGSSQVQLNLKDVRALAVPARKEMAEG